MYELTLEEKMGGAICTAREQVAEKHFYDEANKDGPFCPLGFSVVYRNPGHWDIHAKQCPGKAAAWKAAHERGFTSATDDCRERAFRIRGEPGKVVVMDERWNPNRPHPRTSITFRSIMAAMVYITEELMQQPE